jgi:TfoX/Sxy family transcriptional regulator of competence genes
LGPFVFHLSIYYRNSEALNQEVKTMAYDEKFDRRIKKIVSDWKNTENKKMFGGICHLLNGNMFCGVHKEFLILRLDTDRAKDALKLPHVRPFDITGRPMKGWVMVAEDGFKSDKDLKNWLDQTRKFVGTLPRK